MRRTNRLRAGWALGGGLTVAAVLGPPALAAVASTQVTHAQVTAAHVTHAQVRAARVTAVRAAALELSPSRVVPGGAVTARTTACAAGDASASGNATAVGGGQFTLVRDTTGSGVSGRFRVPSNAQPGTYEIVATCAGSGTRAVGDLVVALTDGTASPAEGSGASPQGSVGTGVGDARDTDPVRTSAGVAELAMAAAGGTWLLYRRARGDGR